MMNISAPGRWLVATFVAALVGFSLLGCSEDVDDNDQIVNQDQQDVEDHDAGPTDDTDPDPSDAGPDADDPDGGEPDGGNGENGGEEPLPDLEVDAISPDRGPLTGGTPFVISGQGFTDDTTVLFGARDVETDVVSDEDGPGELTGTTPEGSVAGPVTVRIQDDETGEETITDGFTYFQPLTIDEVTPPVIDTEGGAEIMVTGSGFSSESQVAVGDRPAADPTVVGSSELRFVAPPHEAGTVDVRVTNENDSTVAADALTYLEAVELEDVEPATGSTDGGDELTLTGQGFDSSLEAFVGNASATVDSVAEDGTQAQITTPPGEAGTVDVRVETDDDGDLLEDAFAYLDDSHTAPALDGVVPATGSTEGDERVVLTGYFAELSSPDVEFGDEQADVVDVDDQTIEVDTPASEPGTVDVTVQDGSTSLTAEDAFQFSTPLELQDLTPAEGDASGGTEVTADGQGFDAVTEVRLAGRTVEFEAVDDQTIEFETPAASPGFADLQVFDEDGDTRLLEDAFEYVGDLELWNFSPPQGSVAGDTYVEIHGTGLTDATEVDFGDAEATDVQLLDPNTLAVRTPPGDTGSVDVTGQRDGQSSTAPQQYTYFNPGAQSGGAWGNPVDGAVNVTVYSMMGAPIDEAFVMLTTDGGTEYKGLTNAAGQVTLSGPDIMGPQTVTATAVEHHSATVQHVDAENITLFLFPDDDGDPPMPPPPPTATFYGEITGLEKIAPDPRPNEVLMAVVQTTRPEIGDDLPDPGGDNIVMESGDYSLQSRVGELALVAIGGLYNTDTEEFRPMAMGTERYLTAAEGGEYEVDIDLDIFLDRSIDLKYEDAPIGAEGGPDTNRAQVFLDLGVDGVYGPMHEQTTDSEILEIDDLAPLTDDLDDGRYEIMAMTDTGGDIPLTQAFVDGIDETGQLYSTPPMTSTVDILTPPAGGTPDDGLVSWELHGPVEPDFYYVMLQTGMGEPVWDVFVAGDSDYFIFPDFPDLTQYDLENDDGEPAVPVPYPGGTFQMFILGFSGDDLSVDNFTYDQLGLDAADAMSINGMWVSLPSD